MKNGLLVTIAVGVWGIMKIVGKLVKSIIWVLTNLVIFFGLYIPLFYLAFGLILLMTTDFTFGVMGTNQILFFVGLGLCFVCSAIITIKTFLVRPLSWIFEPLLNAFSKMREDKEDRRARDREEAEDRPRTDRSRRPSAVYHEDRRSREEYEDYPRVGRREEYPPYEDSYAAPRQEYPAYEDRGYRRPYEAEPPRDDRYAAPSYGREAYPSYAEPLPQNAPAPIPPYGGSSRDREEERPLIYYSRRRPGILVKEYSDRFDLYEETQNGRRYVGTEYKDD